MAKLLLADENFSFPAVQQLREKGHDVVTLQDLGKTEQALPDTEVLILATSMDRAVLTFTRKDFIKLHKSNPNHSGIIVCTLDIDFQRLAKNIHRKMETFESLENLLLRINRE